MWKLDLPEVRQSSATISWSPKWRWWWRWRRLAVDTTSEQRIVLLCASVSAGERVRHEWAQESQVARLYRLAAVVVEKAAPIGRPAGPVISSSSRSSPPTTTAAAATKKQRRRHRSLHQQQQQSRWVGGIL